MPAGMSCASRSRVTQETSASSSWSTSSGSPGPAEHAIYVMCRWVAGRGRRVVTLPRICVGALRAQRVRQVQDKLLAGAGWRETGFVFTNRNGGPLDGDRVSEQFKKALDNAGLPEVRFHDLRHGAASLLLMQGVPSRVVMDVLGHSQIAVTLNTYTHVMPSLVDEAAEAMDRALGSGSTS